MSPSYLGKHIHDDCEHAAEDLVLLAVALTRPDQHGRTVLDRIRAAMNGQPKSGLGDTDRVSASGISDPTGNAALQPDHAAQDLRRLDDIFTRLRNDSDTAVRIVNTWTPRTPTAKERRETIDANAPHCESCISVEIGPGVPWNVEPRADGNGNAYRTTVSDILTEAKWLCSWCEVHVRSRGCLPNTDELEQHRDSKRIRCPHPPIENVA